ncbi:MAG: type II restriction endonuclease [Planctomycetota bacterium]|nr:type II restriction endonuclease [Planctomycetota bacterium]
MTMEPHIFKERLLEELGKFKHAISTDAGEWTVKGFVDVYRNIYTISLDTKVVSKIIELMLFPILSRFAEENRYRLILSEHQNHYPDIIFIAQDGTKIALDLKSTYRTGTERVNGFTLGAFTGYFRQRKSNKNTTFPYEEYAAHFVLGTIYTRSEECAGENKIYTLDYLSDIVSVVRDFVFLVQEKWRIGSNHPGSGNTKNIGSVKEINTLLEGNGPFASHSKEVFDDYWTNYLTRDMAQAIDSEVHYRNLEEYLKWRKGPAKRH